MHAPRRTGTPPHKVGLAGKFVPWKDGIPVFLSMPMSAYHYLPCFSTVKKLKATLTRAGITWQSIKKIDDDFEFLTSVARADIQVILDPYYTEKGTVKFSQLHNALTETG